MLKRIPTAEVKIGMFLQSMEGPWLSHPFWKTKFVIRDASDVEALHRSGVPAVWIDVSKGSDVGHEEPAPVMAEAAQTADVNVAVAAQAPAQVPAAPEPAPPPVPRSASLHDEMGRAAQIVSRSKTAVMNLFGEARMGKAIDAEECLPLVEEVTDSVSRNPSALISLARLKTKDDYTYMHSVAVCALMVSLARHLGMSGQQQREAGLAGLLHDVGKMAMPLEVLNKPGQLTDAEFDVMRTHPVRGYEMLREGSGVPESALDVALRHHEKVDGSGYPGKLKGEEISQLARMGAVCDVYDAITSTRPYKSPWDPAGSIQRMAQWTGHFDAAIFQAFVKSVGIYPVGTLVRLHSGRLAVVVEQSPVKLTSPLVRVFFSTKSQMPIPTELLDLNLPQCNDRIAARENPADWGFTHLDELWMKAPGRGA